MARLRFRFELKTGTVGVPLRKLAKLAEEFQGFLQMVGEDLGTQGLTREWQAVKFYDGSVGFDVEHNGEVDERQARNFSRVVHQVVVYDPKQKENHFPLDLRKETVLRYASMGQEMDVTDSLNLGFYNNGDRDPQEWRGVSKSDAVAVAETLNQIVEYRGMIQGVVHSLFKESQPPHFDVRELSKKNLVRCLYKPEHYKLVVESLRNKDAVVLVSGLIKSRRIDRTIVEISVEKMRAVEPISPNEFEQLHGAAPNLTGGLATDIFISKIRDPEHNGD